MPHYATTRRVTYLRDLLGSRWRERSSRVKISRTCDTVTAGVFPPTRIGCRIRNHSANSDNVMWWCQPTQLRTSYCQARLPLRSPEHLLDPVPCEPHPNELGQGDLGAGVAQRIMRFEDSPRPCASPPTAPPGPTRRSCLVALGPHASTRNGPRSPSRTVSRVHRDPAAARPTSARRNGTPACGLGRHDDAVDGDIQVEDDRVAGHVEHIPLPCRCSQPRNRAGRPISSSPLTQAWGRSLRHRSSKSRAIRHDS